MNIFNAVPSTYAVPKKADPWQRVGDWLFRHRTHIQVLQWIVVGFYLALLIVPLLLPLPDRTATIWNNTIRFAQFMFWGIWWPFVILGTALVGRMWCGLLCPEGSLSEFASRHGRGGAIPKWLQWSGWPTAAFALTTLYGQMTSVYQYPKPAALILGGSTVAAIAVGYAYGRNKRVWCRYLCPVGGVFALLSKLAPLHFRVEPVLWRLSQERGEKPGAIDCAPLVAIKTMRGASDCHMCGRCSGFRGAITLARRSPSHEIIHVAGVTPKPAETVLILAGLMGLAVGAFHWSASPWFIAANQRLAEFLIEAGWVAPLEITLPWWILTNYPERNDVLTLADGGLLVGYVLGTAAAAAVLLSAALALAVRCLGQWDVRRFHHLAQTLIPLAGAGLFLGLSAMTVTQLRSDGVVIPYVAELRAFLLCLAAAWSAYLGWRVGGLYCRSAVARIGAMLCLSSAWAIAVSGWVLFFWLW
ncbi:polyferredoxin [Mycoplana sp. BE70]|uniref:4Fe-4S binding protein n=1 Tax=Mycoplana sp. BE70 TaxID=2817775 RepID=UPI002864C77D|nr:4Fe-4S binding protein [Mycoplana sp. BE70]MDR6756302.1 polyferredoxin [Mycoplana sp. BE70]